VLAEAEALESDTSEDIHEPEVPRKRKRKAASMRRQQPNTDSDSEDAPSKNKEKIKAKGKEKSTGNVESKAPARASKKIKSATKNHQISSLIATSPANSLSNTSGVTLTAAGSSSTATSSSFFISSSAASAALSTPSTVSATVNALNPRTATPVAQQIPEPRPTVTHPTSAPFAITEQAAQMSSDNIVPTDHETNANMPFVNAAISISGGREFSQLHYGCGWDLLIGYLDGSVGSISEVEQRFLNETGMEMNEEWLSYRGMVDLDSEEICDHDLYTSRLLEMQKLRDRFVLQTQGKFTS
jgi:hypothetical protein